MNFKRKTNSIMSGIKQLWIKMFDTISDMEYVNMKKDRSHDFLGFSTCLLSPFQKLTFNNIFVINLSDKIPM